VLVSVAIPKDANTPLGERRTIGSESKTGGIKMQPTPSESAGHVQFDEICAQVGDWEHLPTVVTKPVEETLAESDDDRTTPIDELILAGLVSP
jgi:hypothetical protein